MKEYQSSFIQEMNDRFSTDILDMFYLLFKYSIQAIIHIFNRHTSINHYSSVRLSMITLQISIWLTEYDIHLPASMILPDTQTSFLADPCTA